MRATKDPTKIEAKALAEPYNQVGNGGIDPTACRAQLEALSEYYLSAYYVLHRQALAIVKSPDAADEVIQDAFVDATARIKQGTEIRNLGAWFRIVIYHFCINHKEKRGFQTEPLREDLTMATSGSLAEIAQRQRCLDEIYRALTKLPTTQKSAFLLAEVHGLNYRDIARNLGRTENSVRQLLARARSQIRDMVGSDVLSIASPALRIPAVGPLVGNGRLNSLGERLAVRLHELQTTLGALMERPSELIAQVVQPATAAIVELAVVGALGGLGSNAGTRVQGVAWGSPLAGVRTVLTEPEESRSRREDAPQNNSTMPDAKMRYTPAPVTRNGGTSPNATNGPNMGRKGPAGGGGKATPSKSGHGKHRYPGGGDTDTTDLLADTPSDTDSDIPVDTISEEEVPTALLDPLGGDVPPSDEQEIPTAPIEEDTVDVEGPSDSSSSACNPCPEVSPDP